MPWLTQNKQPPVLSSGSSDTIKLPDVQEMKPTQLSDKEEQEFQKWVRDTDWFKEYKTKYKEEPNLNDPNYNYRGAWKGGAKLERNPTDNQYHWPDVINGKMLKSPHHATAWAQPFMDRYGINPDDLPENDPRIVGYRDAWHKRYPPRRR